MSHLRTYVCSVLSVVYFSLSDPDNVQQVGYNYYNSEQRQSYARGLCAGKPDTDLQKNQGQGLGLPFSDKSELRIRK